MFSKLTEKKNIFHLHCTFTEETSYICQKVIRKQQKRKKVDKQKATLGHICREYCKLIHISRSKFMRLNMFCLISDSVLMISERNWFLSDVETISLALEEEP